MIRSAPGTTQDRRIISGYKIYIGLLYWLDENEHWRVLDEVTTDCPNAVLRELVIRGQAKRRKDVTYLVEVRLEHEYAYGDAYTFGLGARSDEGWRPFEMD